jgi:hypothetical protein
MVQELCDASQLVSQAARKFFNRSSTDPNVLNNPDVTFDPQLNPGTICGPHDVSPRKCFQKFKCQLVSQFSVAVLLPTSRGVVL